MNSSKTKATKAEASTAEWISVKEALQVSGYGNAYLRMHLLKTGKVEFRKELIPGTQIPKIWIKRESLERWMREHPRGERLTLTEDMKEVLRAAGYDIP